MKNQSKFFKFLSTCMREKRGPQVTYRTFPSLKIKIRENAKALNVSEADYISNLVLCHEYHKENGGSKVTLSRKSLEDWALLG